MSKAEVRLIYGRDGETYHGSIWIQIFPTRGYLHKMDFKDFTFARMMSHLAKIARDYDECTGIILEREEAKGTYRMGEEEIRQLREDPAAAISSMQVPDKIVVVRDTPEPTFTHPEGEETIQLRSGHDTIADAFGDYVYCRMKEGRVENPITGRWSGLCRSELTRPPEQIYVTVYQGDVDRLRTVDPGHTGRLELPWFEAGENWLKTRTVNLIAFGVLAGCNKFFLPRRWNKSGPWVSHADLEQMFETYLKEKEDVTSSATNGSTDS